MPDGRVIDDFLSGPRALYATVFGRFDRMVCIVAVEEYKHGPGRVVLKLPSGFVEPGEDLLLGANANCWKRRVTRRGMAFSGLVYDDGNRGMSLGHHFFATDLIQVTEPNADDLDEVRPIVLTPPIACSHPRWPGRGRRCRRQHVVGAGETINNQQSTKNKKRQE